jgi:urea transport system permease protein
MLRSRSAIALTCLVWIVLALAPAYLDEWSYTQLAQYLTYGMFAMSLAFIWGQVGILCFGHALFFGIGAYAVALVTLGRLSYIGDNQLTGILLGIALSAAVANVLGRALFHGRGLSGAYFAIVTLCAAFIAQIAAQHWRLLGGYNGLMGVPPLSVPWRSGFDAYLGPIEGFYAILGLVLLVYVLLVGLERSAFGTVLRAIRENPERTSYFGYDVGQYKLVAFTVSGAIAGLSGGLFAVQFGFVSPQLVGFGLSTQVLIWVAVGGREVLIAAMLGALVVRSVEGYLSDALGTYWLLIVGLLFVAVVVLAPRGLFGSMFRLPLPRRLSLRRSPQLQPTPTQPRHLRRPAGGATSGSLDEPPKP